MAPSEVRKATSEEAGAMALALAKAFQDDPVFAWLIPEPARRAAMLEPAFGFFLRRIWLRHEETYTVPGATAAAIWGPPGTWHLGVVDQLRMLPSFARIWRRSTPRAVRAGAALEARHPKQPHYYLAFLGVEPEGQGRGLGSQLMFPVLSRCDEEGLPAYLEASSPRNCALYERHGFAVTSEGPIVRGSPPIWRMWRDPRPG